MYYDFDDDKSDAAVDNAPPVKQRTKSHQFKKIIHEDSYIWLGAYF